MSIQVGNKVGFAGVSSANKTQKTSQIQNLNKNVPDSVSFKSRETQDPEQIRRNIEIHNAKVRASGYTAIPFFGIFATAYYALKDPTKMAQEQRPDQKKEATFEQEIKKQKKIKEAQVKASLVTVAAQIITAGTLGGLIPFFAYKGAENPEQPWEI